MFRMLVVLADALALGLVFAEVGIKIRGETVTSIGARSGLTNAAHLSRLFRAAYGVSPSEYRAESLPPVR